MNIYELRKEKNAVIERINRERALDILDRY